MADYRSDWDEDLVRYSRKWLNNHPRELSVEELNLLRAFIVADQRLARVDKFLASLR